MRILTSLALASASSIFLASLAFAQSAAPATAGQQLPPQTTLPIRFTRGVDAAHAHAGDVVQGSTTQAVALPGAGLLPAGSKVTGHVVTADPFTFDKTPYAKQRRSVLEIHFDSVSSHSSVLPLDIYVRALADRNTSFDARTPEPHDEDPQGTVTQIGGDLLTPSQKEVRTSEGDIVGYNRSKGVYAHLIAAEGNSPNDCDASDTEQSMGLYSASACGLYGFPDTTLQQTGKTGEPSTLVLTSLHHSPKIWANSTALLEVLPKNTDMAAR